MSMLIPLSHLRDRNVEVLPHEAIAIAQQLMFGDSDVAGVRAPFGPLSLETVAFDSDGRVHCRCSAATPSVAEAAIFLQSLLDHSGSRVPGALRYALGRALHDVEGPPFESLAEFSAALSRFEHGDRQATVRALFARAARSTPDQVRAGAVHASERRRGGPSAAALRRELREADLHLYEARLATLRFATRRTSGGASRVAPMIACVVSGLVLIAAGDYLVQGAHWPSRQVERSGRTLLPVREPVHVSAMLVPLPAVPAARVLGDDNLVASQRVVRRRPAIDWQASVRQATARRESARVKSVRLDQTPANDGLKIRFEWTNPFSRAH